MIPQIKQKEENETIEGRVCVDCVLDSPMVHRPSILKKNTNVNQGSANLLVKIEKKETSAGILVEKEKRKKGSGNQRSKKKTLEIKEHKKTLEIKKKRNKDAGNQRSKKKKRYWKSKKRKKGAGN